MATTFTPKNQTLAVRIAAYLRVQRDFDAFTNNTEALDSETLGDEKEVYEAHSILKQSLETAFAEIDVSELKQAQKEGLLSDSGVRSFIQNKRKLEASLLVKQGSQFSFGRGQKR